VGTYFSNANFIGDGAERFAIPNIVGPGIVTPGGTLDFGGVPQMDFGWYLKLPDRGAKDWGQFGVALTYSAPHGYDLGLYAVQYHEKVFQVEVVPTWQATLAPDGAGNGVVGSYALVYPQNVQTLGMSVSKTVHIVNYALEVSGRRRQDLASTAAFAFPSSTNVLDLDKNNKPAYALGDTIHANFSALASLHPNKLTKESSFAGEVAWNHLVSVTNAGPWYPNPATGAAGNHATANALAFMGVYTPTYRQVISALDVFIPVGFNYAPWGRSALGSGFGGHQTGFVNIGAQLQYHDANNLTVTYQYYIGPQAGVANAVGQSTYAQSSGDRNYVVFSLYRTFGAKTHQTAQ
jgi:hypothetical protein